MQIVSEDQLQAACYQWVYKAIPALRRVLWAIPNGGQRSARVGAVMQSTGTLAGVSDLMLFWAGTLYCFELKVNGRTLTRDKVVNGRLRFGQVEYQQAMTAQGAKCYVVRSLEQFQRIITGIMNNETISLAP